MREIEKDSYKMTKRKLHIDQVKTKKRERRMIENEKTNILVTKIED